MTCVAATKAFPSVMATASHHNWAHLWIRRHEMCVELDPDPDREPDDDDDEGDRLALSQRDRRPRRCGASHRRDPARSRWLLDSNARPMVQLILGAPSSPANPARGRLLTDPSAASNKWPLPSPPTGSIRPPATLALVLRLWLSGQVAQARAPMATAIGQPLLVAHPPRPGRLIAIDYDGATALPEAGSKAWTRNTTSVNGELLIRSEHRTLAGWSKSTVFG